MQRTESIISYINGDINITMDRIGLNELAECRKLYIACVVTDLGGSLDAMRGLDPQVQGPGLREGLLRTRQLLERQLHQMITKGREQQTWVIVGINQKANFPPAMRCLDPSPGLWA